MLEAEVMATGDGGAEIFSSSATGTAFDDDDAVISKDTAMCDSVHVNLTSSVPKIQWQPASFDWGGFLSDRRKMVCGQKCAEIYVSCWRQRAMLLQLVPGGRLQRNLCPRCYG